MPFWNVSGADAQTGEEKTYRVEASSATSAEHKARGAGLLVSGVTPTDPLEVIAAVAQPPQVPQYRSAGTRVHTIPPYTGIVAAAFALRIIAGVSAAISLFLIIVAVAAAVGISASPTVSSGGPFSRSNFQSPGLGGPVFIATLLSAGGPLIVAVFLYGVAQLMMAVRDIAQNSFRSLQ